MNSETLGESCFPSAPETVSRAREEVRKWLGEGHPAYENVRLAVSELVTNAVRHAGSGPVGASERTGAAGDGSAEPAEGAGEPGGIPNSGADSLVLRLVAIGGLLHVEVADRGWSTRNPRVRAEPVCDLAENGRGLAIVAALSGGRWGYRSHGPGLGRTVWCELVVEPLLSEAPAGPTEELPEEPLVGTSALLAWPECGGPSVRVWWLPPQPG